MDNEFYEGRSENKFTRATCHPVLKQNLGGRKFKNDGEMEMDASTGHGHSPDCSRCQNMLQICDSESYLCK
jgi:hypothetical protein